MSVLVDTSIWIDHLIRGDRDLAALLEQNRVLSHPLVTGELACGNLRNRDEIIELVSGLPMATKADDSEVLHFIATHKLSGRGLGLIDIHLLAACRLSNCKLWTRDKRLRSAAETMHLAHETSHG